MEATDGNIGLENGYSAVHFLAKITKSGYYVGKLISKLQIQVATYVFELSAGNCHR